MKMSVPGLQGVVAASNEQCHSNLATHIDEWGNDPQQSGERHEQGWAVPKRGSNKSSDAKKEK